MLGEVLTPIKDLLGFLMGMLKIHMSIFINALHLQHPQSKFRVGSTFPAVQQQVNLASKPNSSLSCNASSKKKEGVFAIMALRDWMLENQSQNVL